MIDKTFFFNKYPFRPLSQSQVNAINFILDAFDSDDKMTSLRWLAYILATVKHETAETYLPIREIGKGRGRAYGNPDPRTGQTYYGRGYVQLTWKWNYERAGKELGIDFVNNPDRVMEKEYAIMICFTGMRQGWFTGKRLENYFNDTKTDWVNARRIINGLDRANLIADYARKFYDCLKFTEEEYAHTAIKPETTADPELVKAEAS